MDVVKFFEERNRMCHSNNCSSCPMSESFKEIGYPYIKCRDFAYEHPEEAVGVVEKWAEEHPIITNRRKIKEVFGKEFIGEVMMNLSEEWLDAEYKAPIIEVEEE